MSRAITKFPHLRVLAIEDNMQYPEILEAMLMDFACDFEVVDNNFDALDMHLARPFDIILIDILVPDIDRWDVVHMLRNMPGQAGRVNIIVVITDIAKERAWLQKIGVQEHVPRPLKIRDLESIFLKLAPGKAALVF
jgi:CheY-like chemotaxis protein